MKIKFLAAAIASSLFAVSAHADISVSGLLQAEVAYNNNQTNHDGKTDFYSGVYDVGSFVNVGGSHEITSTGKLVWEVSTFLTKDEIAPPSLGFLGDRKLYVRYVDSQLGSLTVGRDDSPIRMAVANYDIFNGWASLGTVFDRSSSSRPSHQIKYISPKMNGLTVRASAQLGTTDGTSEPDRGYYASVAYDMNKNFGFDLAYAAEQDRGEVQGKDRNTWAGGVRGEVIEGLTYGVAFVSTESWASETAAKTKNWFVSETLQYVKGDHTFRVGHTHADTSGVNLFLVGYEYALPEVAFGSRKLSSALYLEGSYVDNKAASDSVQGFKASTTAGTDTSTVAFGFYTNF